ncbi:Hypothetical protein R9X50_00212300 [Acrodontium crateriforme]|uniref:rRNA processing protein EBP2 n=1 Tax=Acrodontium crateriforme TaxID=150365 RepID=A0AAQ3R8B3_9PEZI|nr:Hypothetical protein R9X50_00212300 [Acrodontium crateriforme]
MAKDQGLRALLKKQKGVDFKKEHQKKLQKQAEKRKRSQKPTDKEIEAEGSGLEEDSEANDSGEDVKDVAKEEVAAKLAELKEKMNGQASGWETDESEDAEEDDEDEDDGGIDIEGIDSDSESESDEEDGAGAEDDDEEEEEEDIPLSDIESLASDERGDIIPHQRLTINNTAALLRSLKAFALPASLPFSAAQAVTSDAPTEIKDVEDDLTRELAFYKQSLEAVKEGRIRLNKEGMPFTRPTDYFAEMVKSEEQMGKVRAKMVDAAARKKASADARRQRDLKKFGKAVQVAKLQERDKAKRDTLDKINVLKRKREGGAGLTTNEEDMFDVALDDAADGEKAARRFKDGRGGPEGGKGAKRQKKDAKFGFGGKKRFSKSNDAKSSGDVSGFSVKKMKGKGKSQRPGKSRRAAGK